VVRQRGSELTGYFKKIFRCALEKGSELQTWPGHFLLKKTETEILVNGFGVQPHQKVLEVGCGNAFQSALLAGFTRRLVAVDLYEADTRNTHSVGMEKAKRLLECVQIRNVDLAASSATDLPFPSTTFDYILSSNALEHIPEKGRALNEIHRVLKPKGKFILVVPTHIASLCAFPRLPLYMLVRAGQIGLRRLSRKKRYDGEVGSETIVATKSHDAQRSWISSLNAFRRNHPSFPLPEPHGMYRSIFHELFSQTPRRWSRLIARSNFVIEDAIAVTLIPINLIEIFSSEFMSILYSKLRSLHVALGRVPVIKSVGFAWAALCTKR
jgi:SAM-dependent methyltransferase